MFWMIVLGCALFAAFVTAAAKESADDFKGLWKGVDPIDGSTVVMSLTDTDNDGVLELTVNEDFWSNCFALGPNYSKGLGVATGTATVASRDVLNTLSVLTCISDDNVATPLGKPAPFQYLLRSRGRNIVLPDFGEVVHRVVGERKAQESGQSQIDQYIGLWEGVDPLDGSPVRLSLTDVDGNGVLELTMQEEFWNACYARGPNYSKGRGLVNGTAMVNRNLLNTLSALICISDDNVPHEGEMTPNQYTLTRDGNIVLPTFGDFPSIVLHRISR